MPRLLAVPGLFEQPRASLYGVFLPAGASACQSPALAFSVRLAQVPAFGALQRLGILDLGWTVNTSFEAPFLDAGL
eukprot:s748_g19.t1